MTESERLLEKCGWQKLGETWLHPNLEGQGAPSVEDALAAEVIMLRREREENLLTWHEELRDKGAEKQNRRFPPEGTRERCS
jgi:hypothetical protein